MIDLESVKSSPSCEPAPPPPPDPYGRGSIDVNELHSQISLGYFPVKR